MKRTAILAAAGLALAILGWFAWRGAVSRKDGAVPTQDARPATGPDAGLAPLVRNRPHPSALVSNTAAIPTTGPRAFAKGTGSDPAVAEAVAVASAPKAPAPDAPPGHRILLARRTVVTDPAAGPGRGTRASDARSGQIPSARGTRPYIVQSAGPIRPGWIQSLEAAGAIPRGYLPENAWLVELDDAAREAVGRLPAVQALVEYEPGDKVEARVADLASRLPADRTVALAVQTFASADVAAVAEAVVAAGGTVGDTASGPRWGGLRIFLPAGALTALARRGDVQWIEASVEPHLHNDRATSAAHVNASNEWTRWDLTGEGQVIGHADTGLDIGATNGIHPDFRNRIRIAFGRARPGDWSDPDGHGTHTAGSILGSGAMSAGRYRGVAPGAMIAHQSIAQTNGSLTGIGGDIGLLFLQTYTNDARIHADSWGSDTAGAYTIQCRQADQFAWDHPDHLAVFSAGNAGTDGDSNGVIDASSIGSPASAKNVLGVGAAENDRPPGSGGYSSYVYGTGTWLPDYPADPIRNDYVSWSATTNPYAQGMAAFSSRGPAADGRIKPDIVAPGTDIISCRSRVASDTAWGVLGENTNYMFSGGTSMAAPQIAGASALARQYAIVTGGLTNPTAALVKAMLVGGARSLSPGQYGTGAAREIPAAHPNNVEGWGQADIGGTLHPDGRMVRLHDRIAAAADATNEFTATVAVSNRALDVALAWIDFPATAGAAQALVDDLDLEVIEPGGGILYPNGLGGPDRTNTVETVRVPAATNGTYTIRVIGHSVPETGVVAAVYLRGAFADAPILHHVPLPRQPAGGGPYAIVAAIQSSGPFTNGEARLHWTTNLPPAEWTTTNLEWLGGADYRAAIPDQTVGTTVSYYLDIDAPPHAVSSPPGAPASTSHVFQVGPIVMLTVSGTPSQVGSPSPSYGPHAGVSGDVARAEAPAVHSTGPGIRWTCHGWLGTGSVPATGDTYEVSFLWDQDSTLTWLWKEEVGLTQTSSPQGAVDAVTWFPRGATGHTETAWTLAWSGVTPYAFAQWKIDGTRWPDAVSTSPNPATGIPMTGPRAAVAEYMPFWDDTNTNNLLDWFEVRYFGSLRSDLVATNDLDGDLWTNLGENLDNTDPRDPASYPTPPVITNFVPLASPQTSRPPWRVEADITDNFALEVRDCIWREAGDPAWRTNAMTWVATNRFRCDLNPPARGSKPVEYYLSAGDIIGYYLTYHRTTTDVHTVVGSYTMPVFDCAPTGLVIEFSTETVHTNLVLSNFGEGELVWTASLAAASSRLEFGDGSEWSHTGLHDVWHLSTNRVWRGTNAWYCGDDATRFYPDACHAWLDTPPFHVDDGGRVSFRQWIKTEYDSGDHFWDGGVLRLSTNGGGTFFTVTPVGGYPYRIVDNPDSPFPADQPCLAGGGTNGWESVTVDLRAYAGRDAILRFEFGADHYTVDEGWYIGEVALHTSTGTSWVALGGPMDGVLTARVSHAMAVTADPSVVAWDTEEEATVAFLHNDPEGQVSAPLTARRGRFVTATASGPGRMSFDRAFLFRDAATSLVVRADRWAHIAGVTSNGLAVGGPYGPASTNASLPFQHPGTDVVVAATFALNLATNGVPEAWLAQYGWSNNFTAAALSDTDGDGHPAWSEWAADTDPTNGLSALRLTDLVWADGTWRIAWEGGVARTQFVDFAADLTGNGWSPLLTNLPPTAPSTNAALADPGPGFFRLRVTPPPAP